MKMEIMKPKIKNQIRTSNGDPIENWAYRISPRD